MNSDELSKRSDGYGMNNAIAVLLRSYTQAINKQERRTGNLFQQKSKAKRLDIDSGYASLNKMNNNYLQTCFHYIHQNPIKAGLVRKMENWEFSSFKDYLDQRKGALCNKELARDLLDLESGEAFYEQSYDVIPDSVLSKTF